ncbi:hypothetical protein [Lysobacter fragariae]
MHFTIPHDHPSLPGHFPGRPLVAGVVVLDRVVDAIEAAHGPLGPLRLPQVKFQQPLLPGETARIALESRSMEAGGCAWRFRVLRQLPGGGDGDLLASGEVVVA